MNRKLNIIYHDNHIVIVDKPAGLLVQGDDTGDDTLLNQTKEFIRKEYNKPGNVYLGLVHRLDRPTSGIICFAKTSKAAARLSKQFQQKSIDKKYMALVQGKTPLTGNWIDKVERKERNSFVSSKGKIAELSFDTLAIKENTSLVKINLKTGRHHQIRVQFSHRGFPLLGDFRYGSKIKFPKKTIGLHAFSLTIEHPTKKEKMTFTCHPGDNWPKFFNEQAQKHINAEKSHTNFRD